MKRIVAIISIGATLVVGSGCVSSSTGGLEVSLQEGAGQPIVRVDDSFFRRHVDITDALVRRATTGFAEAGVHVRNRFGKDFPLQYKFTWFDADGMEVQSGGRPWEQVLLHGGEDATLSATAPEKRAVRFVVRLRRIR